MVFARTDGAPANQLVPGEPVARATCGPGSRPETHVQGRVAFEDRVSGRSQEGYWCNLERIGWYQGQGTTYVNQSYAHCAYQAQANAARDSAEPGVHVVDASDPTAPFLSTRLTSPALLAGTWESLKVHEGRGLLAGVWVEGTPAAVAPALFDIYDVQSDCAHPVLLNSVSETGLSLPANTLGHEGGWSPDGNTYWSSSVHAGVLTAIDVTVPTLPSSSSAPPDSPTHHWARPTSSTTASASAPTAIACTSPI